MEQKKTLGLALGGGGSRALCHLGILLALEEAGIRIDYISGNSMGSLIGAVYADCLDASRTHDQVVDCFTGGSLFSAGRKGDGLERGNGIFTRIKRCLRAFVISTNLSFRKSFLYGNPCKKAINAIVPDVNLEELKIPLSNVVLNLTDGKLEFIQKGPVIPSVYASTNVGVVFPPYKWNDKEYVDAAPVCSVPVRAARELGADVVLAADIRGAIPEDFTVQNGFDVIRRLEMIESNLINSREAAEADILVKPATGDIFWGDFTKTPMVVEEGRRAVNEVVDELRTLLNS